jgi:vacuolar-type H+-ATPase subunit H
VKRIVCCVIACFFLFAASACERTDKTVETYKKIKEDAKQRAEEAKEDALKTMEKKAQEVLKTKDKKTAEQQVGEAEK